MPPLRFFRRLQLDREPRGQILVIVAAGLITIIAMTGLVVDGGLAWGQQRDNQNAADAGSEAGAVVLAEILTGLPRGDADVLTAVDASITANGVDKVGAWYTDISGNLIDGTGVVVGSTADAAEVGGGFIPPNAAGVQADTSKTFETFLVRVIGFNTLTASADATAVAGYIESVCPASGDCNVLPVTIPLNIITCDGNGEVAVGDPAQEWPHFNVPLTIPLCKNNPGNVGWLDWTPTGGGTSELVTAIGPPGTNDDMTVPGWFYMTATGNINSGGVEDALNYYALNQIPVLIPIFNSTCNTEPDTPSPGTSDIARCPTANVGGQGQNQWYHIEKFVSFLLDGDPDEPNEPYGQPGAFIQGSSLADCEQNGNGATSCLKGMFVRFVGPGATVGPGTGNTGENSAVGIQLIK